jgi:phosphatidylserine/phosphatidylglycerophosphate/cardiolipin synthase-like enzyme
MRISTGFCTGCGPIAILLASLLGCNPAPSAEDLAGTRGSRVDVFFNDPGTRFENMWEPDVIDVMIEMIDGATATIDFAVMGFGRDEVVDAFVRAYDRGVQVRMVGDAGHLYNSGYQTFIDRHIPLVSGNLGHIMHDKFMIVDRRFVFGGTANWTDTDLRHNSNNFFFIDSPAVCADFQAEFDQMFDGAFGNQKIEVDNGRRYAIGDTEVEVWFSPNEDALGRILELVDGAQESIRFTIFAFTKDQIGSSFIRKFETWQEEADYDPEADFRDRKSIAGMIDQSQLHSNGQYHEVFRLLGAGLDLRMDGNDNSKQPGDYQAGGGRLHSKTMLIDAYGEAPVVITGSFNWSSSATLSNDEYMLVFHGSRVAKEFDRYFENLWSDGRKMGGDRLGENGLEEGSLVINEIQWYGRHDYDDEGFDEFIELRNMTDQEINLDLWQIANPDDFIVGFPPGSRVPPYGLFTILDHTLEPYQDGAPQDEVSAYSGGDLVLNAFNDTRQSRLYIKDSNLELLLKDPDANIVDIAGDGGAAFTGGPANNGEVRSMERNAEPGDGSLPDAWHACSLDEGGEQVNDAFKSFIFATPGQENSEP